MAIFSTYLLAVFGALMGSTLRTCITGRNAFFIASAVVLALGGFLAGSVAANYGVSPLHVCAAVALAEGLMYWYSLRYEESLKVFWLLAPKLSSYARRNFSRLDVDGNGLITMLDLYKVCEDPDLSRDDTVMVKNLLSDLSFIGHKIDTDLVMPINAPGAHHVMVVSLYGISPEDLDSYSRRAAERFEESASLLYTEE